MKYFRCHWKHDQLMDPVVIYSELDADQWEQRKVEVFSDGHKGYADKRRATEGTILGLEPWPNLAVINTDPQFELAEITKKEFEALWLEAISNQL